MQNDTKVVAIYRDALRSFWNHHLLQLVQDPNIEFDKHCVFTRFREMAQELMLGEGQRLQVKLCETLDLRFIWRKVPESNGNVYWEPVVEARSIDIERRHPFLGFFDFDESGIRDLKYVLFSSGDGVEHLVEFEHCAFFIVPERKPPKNFRSEEVAQGDPARQRKKRGNAP